METSPGTVFPDAQPRLGEKRKLIGERGLQPPPIWFSAAGGAGEQPRSRGACVEGLGRASWGRPRSPLGWGSSPPLGLRSATLPHSPLPQAPSPQPSDPLTPHASFQQQLPPPPPKPEPHHCCLLRPSRRHREFLPDSPGLHPALLAQAL